VFAGWNLWQGRSAFGGVGPTAYPVCPLGLYANSSPPRSTTQMSWWAIRLSLNCSCLISFTVRDRASVLQLFLALEEPSG